MHGRSLCTAGAFLALSGYARADTLGDYVPQPSIPAFSFNLDDEAQIRGIAQLGATGLADLSATDDEDGVYDRFQDQIETLLAAGQAVKPPPDRFKWAILLIAFAGMTAAASGRRRASRVTITI